MNKKKIITLIILTTVLLFMGLQLMAGQFFPSGWGTEKGTQQSISKKRETEHGLQRNHMSRGMSLRRTDTHSIVDDRINQMRLAAYLSALGGTASDPLPVWSTDKQFGWEKQRERCFSHRLS